MKRVSVARRYAKALIDIGREENRYERFGREMRDVLSLFKGSPELYKILLNPMYRLEDRKRLMEKIGERIGVSEAVVRLLVILVETRKIRLLEDICSAYFRMEDELSGRLRAVVESPVELPQTILDEIKNNLSSSTKRDVTISFMKNPELIGGLVIKTEGMVFDGSLRRQLENLKEKLLEGVV